MLNSQHRTILLYKIKKIIRNHKDLKSHTTEDAAVEN